VECPFDHIQLELYFFLGPTALHSDNSCLQSYQGQALGACTDHGHYCGANSGSGAGAVYDMMSHAVFPHACMEALGEVLR
jgi:hypothetical protein